MIALRWYLKRARRVSRDETFSDPGISVEADCRKCGQFNRVPSHRLRDRPKCGRCKERLMPGRRVVFCRTYPMEGIMRAELDALWKDEDQLWQCLADHAAIKAKAAAEARGEQPREVN
jgi:ferredoxin-NADP reductase